VTPFKLVYGQDAVLPIEVNLQACKVAYQDELSAVTYGELMMDKIDVLDRSQPRTGQTESGSPSPSNWTS
jgi:hypothetical protein